MKLIKTFYLISMITLFSSQWLMAQPEIFPKGEKAPNVHHTGDVWLNHLADADENFDFNVVQATMVKCEPEVEHWHAATPNTPVTYIAISGNAPTKWTDTIPAETYNAIKAPELSSSDIEKEIKELSKKKWDWMADKDVEKLEKLFHDKAKFVHMSGSWKKDRELEIIETGSIWYKKAEVHDVAVETFGDDTAVLWNRITLTAHVRGDDVSNEFTVTEFYKKEGAQWKLLDLTFSSVRDDHEIQK